MVKISSLNISHNSNELNYFQIQPYGGCSAEPDKVEKTFRQQLMNCVNTLICHRLNDHTDAEEIANWVGTQDKFKLTAQVTAMGESNM